MITIHKLKHDKLKPQKLYFWHNRNIRFLYFIIYIYRSVLYGQWWNKNCTVHSSFVHPEKAITSGLNLYICIFISEEKLSVIRHDAYFQCGLELIRIQQILIGLEALLENLLFRKKYTKTKGNNDNTSNSSDSLYFLGSVKLHVNYRPLHY